jgi:hypothetical protein
MLPDPLLPFDPVHVMLAPATHEVRTILAGVPEHTLVETGFAIMTGIGF